MKYKLVGILLLLTVMAACSGIQAPADPQHIAQEIAPRIATPTVAAATIESRVNDLLSQMTLDEKIGQMTQVEKDSIKPKDVSKYYIGSVISGGGGFPPDNTAAGWREMVSGYQKEALSTRLGIPILYGTDAIHGHANLYGATIFPQQIGLGATRDAELIRQVGQATAEELLATGVTWNFAPVVAAPQDIRWGRTYESYSEDTNLVSELSAAYLAGLQTLPDSFPAAEGQSIYVLATPKHFLGDGGTAFGSSTQNINQPYLLDQGDTRFSDADTRTLFLPPYQQAVQSGAMSIMVSFSSWNGVKMHAQKYWISDVLKGELGFEGMVVSDWGGIDQVNSNYEDAVVSSINAGIDMNMVPYDYIQFINIMKKAVKKGEILPERIDDAVRRILTVKFNLGLFDQPYGDDTLLASVGSPEHRLLAREAVQKSLVLLKNENETLPLAKTAPSIFVAGQAADDIGMQCGGWTIQWQGGVGDIQSGTSVLEGIQETVASGVNVNYHPSGAFDEMADVGIAVVGEQPYAEGAGDVSDLSLSSADIQVINNLRAHVLRLVVVIISGRPLIITAQYPLADAWVAAWLPGSEGAGISDVLFGDAPFVGKLPYTWPRTNEQLPLNLHNAAPVGECSGPLFPLGYGMGKAGSQPITWLDCD